MGWEIRPIKADAEEFEKWTKPITRAFEADTLGRALGGGRYSEANLAQSRPNFEFDRTLATFDGGEIVGTIHSYPLKMRVPGGNCLPTAGVAHVTVQPTHRRRGILTAMMRRQFQDLHERGDLLAALGATESIIYGRFGYGIAMLHEEWTLERQHSAFAVPIKPLGRTRFVNSAEMRAVFPEIYQNVTADRPGTIHQPLFSWDPTADDSSKCLHVIYERDGRVDGYVTYDNRSDTLKVDELMAVTDEAYAVLWQFCFDVDLKTSIVAGKRPTDDPLVWMLADPRRLKRSVIDGLWIRLVDVQAALTARRYAQQGRLVIEVHDAVCPWNAGCYELEGSECRRSNKSPEIVLSVADLAATYLGGVKFSMLAHAGRVEERTPGALLRADAMFSTNRQPWCPMWSQRFLAPTP
jgi:predicted acetyltransferase